MNPLIRAAAVLVASAPASSVQAVPITWEITGTLDVLSNLGAWNVDPALGTLRIGDPFSVLYTFDDAAEGVAGTDRFGSNFIDYANAVQEMQIGIGSLSYSIQAQPVGSLVGSFVFIGQASISQDGEVIEYDSSWFARAPAGRTSGGRLVPLDSG